MKKCMCWCLSIIELKMRGETFEIQSSVYMMSGAVKPSIIVCA